MTLHGYKLSLQLTKNKQKTRDVISDVVETVDLFKASTFFKGQPLYVFSQFSQWRKKEKRKKKEKKGKLCNIINKEMKVRVLVAKKP